MKSAFRSVDLVRPALIAFGAGVALSAAAVHTEGSEKTPTIVSGDTVTWGSAPPSLPPGAQATVLLGSPAKEGPFVLRLKAEDKRFDDWAAVLLEQAILAEGGQLDDPATFVKRINQLMLDMSEQR